MLLRIRAFPWNFSHTAFLAGGEGFGPVPVITARAIGFKKLYDWASQTNRIEPVPNRTFTNGQANLQPTAGQTEQAIGNA